MATNEHQDQQAKQQAEQHRPSSTSPLDGRTDKATAPPGQGEVDREAVEKGWEALDRAAGGH
ncbi:MAG TPA: hypothetical protein VEW67_06135 [Thermoleophilaceae bacterium]|nr:hypothetical protein [Thermoleophilaceae bacterium]